MFSEIVKKSTRDASVVLFCFVLFILGFESASGLMREVV